MSVVAEVRLWGRTIGAVAQGPDDRTATFEYDRDFIDSGIQVAPLLMPLARRLYRFPELSTATFHGLPGLLADSLPDRFGNALINAWLARQGRPADSLTAIERLCYLGTRGMGALEFFPAISPRQRVASQLDVGMLADLAAEVLRQRVDAQGWLNVKADEAALRQILRVGTSAGGARAKAIIAWNPATNEVRSGQVAAPEGFEYWIMKFDGIEGGIGADQANPAGYGAIEYAYHLMARAAGITMSDCRLYEEHSRRHFMTRRFDRLPNGAKRHMQTLGALAHLDYNEAGAHSYEQAFHVLRELRLGAGVAEELFRRMVFNIIARNQDDHVKNIAFLMDKAGQWSLAPAYDLTFSYNPAGVWTGRHQMSVCGKRDGFTRADILAVAAVAGLKHGRGAAILAAVTDAAGRWPDHAETAGIPETSWRTIRNTFRLDLKDQ